jgi:adenine-specific DNA-methyltransferase
LKTNIEKKESGSYYTPPLLADFIAYHLFGDTSEYSFAKSINVLEPSAGDGVFFDALFNNQFFKNRFKKLPKMRLTAVEYDPVAYDILKDRTQNYESKSNTVEYINNDYLKFQQNNQQKFDLIIGNPPYIKSSTLTKEQVEICESIHKASNLSSKKIKNIWTSFLVGGVQSLSSEGVLCFVLPAELLQVIYAKEIRDYLKDEFEKIEIFTFNELVFADIEQDAIILFCSKKGKEGVSFYHVDKLQQLEEPSYVPDHSNVHRKTLDKWTNYILSDGELRFLDGLRQDLKLEPIKSYCSAVVGVVTAANSFFIVNDDLVKAKSLSDISKPMLQKGLHRASGVELTKADLQNVAELGIPTNFLAFENESQKNFSSALKDYIREGEAQSFHTRYKMLLRDNWYYVPSVWVSEGFFTKRSSLFPRMYINTAEALVTDSFYRIKMNDNYNIKDLVFSFHNTLSFIYAELEGRYYGGGVLELMPNEYKTLPVPFVKKVSAKQLKRFDTLLRRNAKISEILQYTNEIILKDHYGMSNDDIDTLGEIYQKLLTRRLKKQAFVY